TEIDVSLGRQSSGSAGIEVGLYDDAAGVPGTKIKSVHVTQLPRYGECCGVTTATFKGIAVKAGTQYWVVISTTSKDIDIYAWAFNSSDMRPQLAAARCTGSSTYCGNNSGVWVPFQYVQNGFQVLGH
ncbi:MAG TPA: choice-of-anchor R domain-containing protein, partial [Terracidiphilus sp.]